MSAKHIKEIYGTMYYVKNIKKALKSYCGDFGGKVRYENSDWAEVQFANHVICLHKIKTKEKKLPSGIVIFTVKKMAELVKKLKKAKYKMKGEPHAVHGDVYSLNFTGIDGNELSLYGKLK